MINIVDREMCCGCTACADRCPKQCISMICDEEGFQYPCVNHDKCINCGACNEVCPIECANEEKNEFRSAYAAWNKDDSIRIQSTSGGVFTAIAETVIQQNGVVLGAQYNEDHQVSHIATDHPDGISKLRQSKYVQSKTKGIYIEAKKALSTGRTVLFCGTPCQTEALVKFLKGKPNNLILCDFICRGVISPIVYRKYLEYLEKKYASKVKIVHFKNKTYGWHRFSTKITFENGKTYIRDRYHDSYMLLYLKENVSLRPSCYHCHFKGVDRCSDITLGDFWGAQKKYNELDNDRGTSAVLVHTKQGEEILGKAEKYLELHPVDVMDIVKGNECILKSPVSRSDRKQFFDLLQSKGYSYVIKRYCNTLFFDLKQLMLKGVKNVKK
ncbi:MAG: Coenzyme F420 hydrogenase/dehydrogenase, beta subunit C-terminal domain [Eubacteriales bacterium]|nr:Coenzyme F420 hydrogenase/dehydrogenase, beta subunit C-terminal domain [Eubacteriales bacterium]